MLLKTYLGQYLLTHEAVAKYRRALGYTIDCYSRFLTELDALPAEDETKPTRAPGLARLADLNDKLVNRYLAHINATWSPSTVKGERARLLAIWRDAFAAELVDLPPLRVRKVAVPEKVIDAWDESQLAKLLTRCEALRGRFKNKWRTDRRDFALALVNTAYDLAARLGDLEDLTLDDIAADGSVFWIQNKTGKEHSGVLEPETIAAIRKIAHPDRPTVFGRALNRRYFFRWIKRLIESAGLTGTFRWIRRSSGSLVDRDHPGWGHRHLGNTQGVFRKHYDAKKITAQHRSRPRPPRLGRVG